MSYDLQLFRLSPGEDPRQAYIDRMEADERAAPDPEDLTSQQSGADGAKMQRLADRLLAVHPAFRQSDPQKPLRWVELTDDATSLQVEIQMDSAAITRPYFGENAGEIFHLAARCIRVLEDAAGFVAWDPQQDRLVRPADLTRNPASYRQMDKLLPELRAGAARQSRKPWWKFW